MATIHGTNGSEVIDVLDGVTNDDDWIFGNGGHDTIYGFGGNDRIRGDGGNDTIYAGSGDDTLTGGDGNDTMDAGNGDDTLTGGNGADTMIGGFGTDTANYKDELGGGIIVDLASGHGFGGAAAGDTLSGIENVNGTQYNDILIGDGGNNVLDGHQGDDTLKGGGGADTLYGNVGEDVLVGGAGADKLIGGGDAGNYSDTAAYYKSPVGVFVSLYSGIAAYGHAEGDEFQSIENVTGSNHHDNLQGDDDVNVLQGMGGNDTLKGFGGSDTLDGGAGADTMLGGLDNDIYIVDNAGDLVNEAFGQGGDTVRTSIDYTLTANVENLTTTNVNGTTDLYLAGNSTYNYIAGNDGDNVIDGGGSMDTMVGHDGDDIYIVDHAADQAFEAANEGHDVVYSHVDYFLEDNVEELSLNVGSASSAIGNSMDNVVYGNAFDNFLNGGYGADQLSGLGGNDTFIFQVGQANGDTIYEFNGNGATAGDLLYFVGYGTAAEGATLTQLTATDWQITSVDGLTQETITLSGAPSIDASDFVFV